MVSDATRWVVSSTGDKQQATSPFPGVTLEAVPMSSTADVVSAVHQVRAVQRQWAARPLRDRRRVLHAAHRILLGDTENILDTIQAETGKARGHAVEELLHAAMNAGHVAKAAHRELRPARVAGMFPLMTRVRVHRVPKGVVGVITPWNYPFSLAFSDAVAAIAAGNAVVIKPDSQTVGSVLRAVEVLYEAGIPDGLVSVVVGDGPIIGGALIDEVDYVCFTGSTVTGRVVAERAAKRLIGCSLELGGKNPMIVCADADIDRLMDIAVHACFTSAGQLCVSTERMYVHRDIYDRVVDGLVSRVSSLQLGARPGWGYDVGSLTTAAQRDRVTTAIDRAVGQGARVAVGGSVRGEVGPLVVEPTVLTDVRPDMDIATREVFGPVVFVTPVDSIAQAVELANASTMGLSASVITRDVANGRRIAAQLACGSVNINDGFAAAFGSIAAPMGGMRESGLGRRHGADGLLRFTEPQTVAQQRMVWPTPQWGVSGQQWSRLMVRSLRLLKALRLR